MAQSEKINLNREARKEFLAPELDIGRLKA